MLRREPTKITLTMDDIAQYEARKAQADLEKQRQNDQHLGAHYQDTLSQDFARKPETRSREQRIGLSGPRS